MNKLLLTLLLLWSCLAGRSQVLTLPLSEPATPGLWLCFRTRLHLDKEPSEAELRIAADSKYWLWTNGTLQVREGGLKRGPNPQDTYCDVLHGTRGLHRGDNTVAVLVWYFGKDGFSHRNSPTPGLAFSLKVDGKPTDTDGPWRVCRHPAYYLPQGEAPNYRLPESNIGFDASRDIPFQLPDYDDRAWSPARVLTLEQAGWNRLADRPIPQWKDYGLKTYTRTERKGNQIYAYLPYNAQVTPYLKINAPAGLSVDIRTDNYRGGSATNVFARYTTRQGEQEFECRGWMNGHCVIYTLPDGCEVQELKYRETGYDTAFDGSFWCDDPFLTRLWTKAQRTLYLTMRDTYMDCPDRERAQWWGDVVNELGEAFYALDEKAHLLTRKGISELVDWQRADSTLFAPVPAGNYKDELPMQMLASVGRYGFWTYYMGTGDRELMEYVYPKVKKYIHVWKTAPDGLVIPRRGGWTWGDWGDNKDMELLFNLWYAIALDGYGRLAQLTGHEAEARWADATAARLKTAFHRKYWNGTCYRSPGYTGEPDDRAQALAVVSGTLPPELYPVLRPFFGRHYHASPYMEKYVLQALCQMGCHQDAMDRMRLRYKDMTDSPLTTLWEGWGIGNEGFGGGSYNHAWSGGPLTILSQYIAGIETVEPAFSVFSVCPHPGNLSRVKATVPLSEGRSIGADIRKDPGQCSLLLTVPRRTQAVLLLPQGYSRLEVDGKPAEPGTRLKAGSWQVVYR